MPQSQGDASPLSPPQFEEFSKAFLVKHRQVVENVLRESCGSAIEAITRQTYNLMVQDDGRGCLARSRSEPKLVSEPEVLSKPSPQVLGSNRTLEFCTPSPASETAGLITSQPSVSFWDNEAPQKPRPSPGASSDGQALSPSRQHTCDRLGDRASGLTFATLPSIASPFGRIKSLPFGTQASEALRNRGIARSSMRRSVLELSLNEEGEQPKIAHGVLDFFDGEAMKEKLRLQVAEPNYCVTQFYHTTGTCQAIARSHAFEQITLGVIALNAMWISVDVDHNDATLITNANPIFLVADNAFCSYFLFELLIRYGAFRCKRNTLKDSWFVFDFAMLMTMVLDTWLLPLMVFALSAGGGSSDTDSMADTSVLKAFRLVRLVRMARVLKLLNALPELMVVIKGLFVATRAVSCTVVLMLLIIYVFAITFRQICADTELGSKYFVTVPTTMRFLLVLGTSPDLYDYVNVIWEEGAVFALLFLFFILIVTITIMNMLVGVLVGVVNTVASVEKENLMVHFVRDNLLSLLKIMHEEDQNLDEKITKEEFRRLICNPDAVRSFTAMGVDVCGLVDLGDFIFQDHAYLNFGNFLELVMQLRGSNSATVKDIVDLRRFITMEFNAVLHALELIPHDAELYTEVSKTVSGAKSISFETFNKTHGTQSMAIGAMATQSMAIGTSSVNSIAESSIIEEPLENEGTRSETAGENARKKKLRKKHTSPKSNEGCATLLES